MNLLVWVAKVFVFALSISVASHLATSAAFAQIPLPPVSTAPSVDLEQYLGTWYEIAAIPKVFEKQCVGNTTAEYAHAKKGLISVVNSCDTAKGNRSVAHGRAKVMDTNTNAKLKVTFVHFLGWQFILGGDYWILALGDQGEYAVIGAPGRDYAWILSRKPELAPNLLAEAAAVFTKQGFDTCRLITTPQTGGIRVKSELCKVVSAD